MCDGGSGGGVPSLLNHIGDLLENQSVFVDVGYMQGDICAGGGQLVLVYESVGNIVESAPSLEFLLPVAHKELLLEVNRWPCIYYSLQYLHFWLGQPHFLLLI